MNPEHRTTLRIASLIRDQASAQERHRLAALAGGDRHLTDSMSRYLTLCRMAAKACSRQWLAAAAALGREATCLLEELRYLIEGRRRQRLQGHPPVCSLGDIVRDLGQLQQEFHDWQFDPQLLTLSVRTDCIELEDVSLGPFEIQLRLRDLCRPDLLNAFDIIALEPNSAAGHDHVTHPHVSDQRLCPGEGTVPIQSALEAGRICDFFLLVRSVLQTYNPGSAYVRLDEWSGEACHACGDLVDEEGGCHCEFCEHRFCESCTAFCSRCDSSACRDCLESCPHCQEHLCPNCMSTCRECRQPCCDGCLSDGLCPTCQQAKENEYDPDTPEESVAAPAPGQAA